MSKLDTAEPPAAGTGGVLPKEQELRDLSQSQTTPTTTLTPTAPDPPSTMGNLVKGTAGAGPEEQQLIEPESQPWYRQIRCYSIYVLVVLLLAYLLNQLDRYMLAITIEPLAQDVKFGDLACMANTTFSDSERTNITCSATSLKDCDAIVNANGSHVCRWDYNGQGIAYQVVAGPVFILIYTFMGIPLGFAADSYNRKILLAVCLLIWSAFTILTGLVNAYWQLVIVRLGLGAGEAGCTPFAASLITDYFPASLRGSALGFYNWGIYMGYSMSYAIGNLITVANINGQGWRWAFFIAGIPGIAVGIILLLTVREPERRVAKSMSVAEAEGRQAATQAEVPLTTKLKRTLRHFINPSLLLLCFAGSIRNAGGYTWAYNTQPYFTAIKQTKSEIATYMSWVPLVAGSFSVVVGGFISDRLVKKLGLYARVMVLAASQLLAAPFAAGTLFFDPPYAYLCQIPTYIIGEVWVSVTLAVMVELVPSYVRTSAVAVYLFIITNIGGNLPLLVPPLQRAFEGIGYNNAQALRGALYIMYPGMYVGGGLLFLLTMCLLRRDQRRALNYEQSTTVQEKTE